MTNRNGGDTATEVKQFAPSLDFHNTNAVCWTKDGSLFVSDDYASAVYRITYQAP